MWSNFVKTGNPTPPAQAVRGEAYGAPTLQGIEDIVWRPVMPAASEVQYRTYTRDTVSTFSTDSTHSAYNIVLAAHTIPCAMLV